MSLYDQYRLSNSSVIPMFTGTAAPEAVQVGAHLQQLYDVAKTGAGDVMSASDNLQSLDRDIPLQNEVRNKIRTDIDKMAASKDWENQVEPVRKLGQYYAQRSMELAAPMKQFQEYQKGLDAKELNLTPEQKMLLIARSKAGYKGLQKDQYGRFVGTFSGVGAAENIDLPKWVHDTISGMKEFSNASSVEASNNGGYIVKRAGKTEYVSKDRVDQALKSAIAMNSKVQSYIGMEGDNAAFQASRVDINRLPDGPVKQQILMEAQRTGRDPREIYSEMAGGQRKQGLLENAFNYARNKFVYKKTESETGLSSDATWLHNQKEAAKNGIFADLATGQGIDLTAQYGSASDVDAAYTAATTGVENAKTQVQVAKQVIAKSLGTDISKLTDKQISDYYSVKDPTGFGKYKANVEAIQSNSIKAAELKQLRDVSMDLAVKKKFPGQSFEDLKNNATTKLKGLVDNGLWFQYSVPDPKGGTTQVKVNKDNIKNYEVIDGDQGLGTGGDNYIVVRNKETGATHKIRSVAASDRGDIKKLGSMFDNIDWKSEWKEAARNIRSNSMWMPLQNKSTPDGEMTKAGAYASRVSGLLRSSANTLSIKDANLQDYGDGSNNMKARIAAGKFDILGVGKVGSDGKLYAQLSVLKDEDASDPADRYRTVVVGMDSNMANKLSRAAIEAGQRDGDIRAMQFGRAMAPGSGYEQVLAMGTTGRLQVNETNLEGKEGAPLFEVVPNITGNASDALGYEVYELDVNGKRLASKATFNDAFDLGAWLDENQRPLDGSRPRIVKKKTN